MPIDLFHPKGRGEGKITTAEFVCHDGGSNPKVREFFMAYKLALQSFDLEYEILLRVNHIT